MKVLGLVTAAVALCVVVPLFSLQRRSETFLLLMRPVVAARFDEVDPLRALRVAPDPTITADEAGIALHALLPARGHGALAVRPVAAVPIPTSSMPAAVFADVRTPQWWGPDAGQVITRAARGVSPAEMTVLETVSAWPAWRAVDRVAHAPRADIVGGRYIVPFPAGTLLLDLPTINSADVKRFAHASVARAAYFVARQDYAQADAVLRNSLSLGLLLMDEAPTLLDAVYGQVIVGVVAGGMAQLSALTGDRTSASAVAAFRARGKARTAAQTANPVSQAGHVMPTVAAARTSMLRDLRDTSLLRAVRWERLHAMQWTRCAEPLALLRGSSPLVGEAADIAHRMLARSTGEHALVALLSRGIGPGIRDPDGGRGNVVAAMGQVASAVTGRSEIAGCTRLLSLIR